ncbi:ribonuclease H protein, partial [Trifolium medium]|nr:ribonuclease H protein [Trifolium medium]
MSCSTAFDTLPLVPQSATNPRRVSWYRPAEGIVCLNVDGSLLGSSGTAGYGGLLRDHNGDFIWGFYGTAAVNNILYAELM